MNKRDIIDLLAERVDLSKTKSAEVVGAVFDILSESLAKDEAVAISGFGTFKVKVRQARKGRNPKTGAEIQIPESQVVSFKQAESLKDALQK